MLNQHRFNADSPRRVGPRSGISDAWIISPPRCKKRPRGPGRQIGTRLTGACKSLPGDWGVSPRSSRLGLSFSGPLLSDWVTDTRIIGAVRRCTPALYVLRPAGPLYCAARDLLRRRRLLCRVRREILTHDSARRVRERWSVSERGNSRSDPVTSFSRDRLSRDALQALAQRWANALALARRCANCWFACVIPDPHWCHVLETWFYSGGRCLSFCHVTSRFSWNTV